MTGPWIAAFVVLACVVLLLAVLVLGLFARVERLAVRPEVIPGPDMHARASVGGVQIGESVSMVEFDAAGSQSTMRLDRAVVLFGSSGCGPCELLRDELTTRPLAGTGHDQILVWDGADAPSVPGWRTLADRAEGLRSLLGVESTPYCFVTDADSVVLAAGVPNSIADIRQLLDEASTGRHPTGERG